MLQLYLLGQLVLAITLGGILGAQREYRGRQAGFRTYALVCAGASLFTAVCVNFFGPTYQASANVAAQIVTGVGFLGAGMILHKENRIEGLTTAAGLWAVAAIGMVVGVRYFVLAIGATLFIFLVLAIDDRRFHPKVKERDAIIENKNE